ncbi:MAG: cytochrome c oxidase accessory protein CcoG [Opitutaceae bacterium]|nr:cytochrome c oxidase accessory protein CcoG [Opitutaceae bacterium]
MTEREPEYSVTTASGAGGPAKAVPAGAAPAPNLDSVTTINSDGSRRFIHPADVGGRFTTWRRLSAYALILVYLSLPWIPVGGYPAVFLDLAQRRFHFFGWILSAQDAWLLFFLFAGLGFTLFLLTALLGRLWCGWACPQTVFLDHVYRRIERWIEGDARARRALDSAPWSKGKFLRRGAKQLLFALVSLVIAHLFLAYFVSLPALGGMMLSRPGEHWAAFVFVFVFAGILHFNYAWFREQLCIVICPYGRLQSALVDEHTLNIGYDSRRGEPRGRRGTPGAADCVACNRCVQVCPTGIDIRQGLQMECIGCAACVDACNEVMTRVHKPRGLIRYDSLAGLAGGRTRWLRPRIYVYAALLLAGAVVAGYAFSTVKPAGLSVVRITGAPYFVDAASVRNQFFVRIVNKRPAAVGFSVTVEAAMPGLTRLGLTEPVAVAGLQELVAPLVLVVARPQYAGPFPFTVRVRDAGGTFTLERRGEFLGPEARLLREEETESLRAGHDRSPAKR